MNRALKAVLATALVMFVFSCQDHHFVPIEKAEKLGITQQKAPVAGQAFETKSDAQKEVMSPDYREKTPAVKGTIAQGALELGASQKKRDFTGFAVYIIVWEVDVKKDGKVFPVAVSKVENAKFPISFSLDETNVMAGSFPDAKARLMIEARLDRDTDPITKEPGDVYGFAKEPFYAGAKGIVVTLDQERK